MFSIIKKLVVVGLLVGLMTTIVQTAQKDIRYHDDEIFDYNPFIENVMLSSSRFTQPEDMRAVDPEHFVELNANDDYLFDNTNFELYMDEDTLSFKVLDKRSGYIWSTAVENPQAGTYNSLLKSGVGLEYINIQQNHAVVQNLGLIDIEHSVDISIEGQKVIMDIQLDYYCPPGRCQRFYDFYMSGDERYTFEDLLEQGYLNLDTSFRFVVELTEEGLKASIPFESIQENNKSVVRLSSIIIFAGLGATHMDDIPGYMIIPDGVGALIRYTDKQGQYTRMLNERFYGDNDGIVSARSTDINYPLSMPIFGAVHGVHQQGFIGIIEEGAMNARLQAFPNGAAFQPYNLIFTKYDLQQVYRQSFSSDGSGGTSRIHQLSTSDVLVRYNFVTGEQADYVGLAQNYQSYLAERGDLSSLEVDYDRIPMHFQYLMADSKSQFIGTSTVQMTPVNAVKEMYDHFYNAGITEQRVSLLGWNRGGYSGHLPSPVSFERSLGNNQSFRDLIAHITQNNEVMLVNNYVYAGDSASRISYRNDVALGVNRFRLIDECMRCVHPETYTLYPSKSHDLAMRDLEDYQDLGANVLFETLGSMLFSYYRRDMFTRDDGFEIYESIMEAYDGVGDYFYPHAYAYRYAKNFFDAPLYNSQLNFYDDLVPFLPIVLSGHMELYSQFLNFNSLGRVQLLMLVDFGINPSFLLTEARPSNLMGTDIRRYYASQFSVWSDTVLEQYNYINDALSEVIGERIETREVLDYGVVKVTYANGVEIVINYSQAAYIYNGTTISPVDYHVMGVSS